MNRKLTSYAGSCCSNVLNSTEVLCFDLQAVVYSYKSAVHRGGGIGSDLKHLIRLGFLQQSRASSLHSDIGFYQLPVACVFWTTAALAKQASKHVLTQFKTRLHAS